MIILANCGRRTPTWNPRLYTVCKDHAELLAPVITMVWNQDSHVALILEKVKCHSPTKSGYTKGENRLSGKKRYFRYCEGF